MARTLLPVSPSGEGQIADLTSASTFYEAVIVGAGPAGLAAATSLGRARRRVLVLDGGPPRNITSLAVHGFLTREQLPPSELLQLARAQLAGLTTVSLHGGRARAVRGDVGRFVVELETGRSIAAQRVLLCVGIEQELPDIPGCHELWGKHVFECPYCHGFEQRNRELGYLAPEPEALEFALLLRAWSPSVRVFTDGRFEPSIDARNRLSARGISIESRPLVKLSTGATGRLEHVELQDGSLVACQALFVRPRRRQMPLVTSLELDLDAHGNVEVNDGQETSRPGISAAGDLTSRVHLAVAAAAAGTIAGNTIVERLMLAAG
jgi:thioredoxin reductase